MHPIRMRPAPNPVWCICAPSGTVPAVRISLTVFRGYLILMTLMLSYHVLDLAEILHHLR